eukprot:1538391-Prymnesium_polylepis.1
MMLRVHSHALPTALAAVRDAESGVQARARVQWPRLMAHLLAICSRADLARGRTAGHQSGRGASQTLDDLVQVARVEPRPLRVFPAASAAAHARGVTDSGRPRLHPFGLTLLRTLAG